MIYYIKIKFMCVIWVGGDRRMFRRTNRPVSFPPHHPPPIIFHRKKTPSLPFRPPPAPPPALSHFHFHIICHHGRADAYDDGGPPADEVE